MKTSSLIAIGFLVSGLPAPAQFNFNNAFDSGSTGTIALNITTSTTLDLPPDGILHYTTINVSTGATLRFNRNLANTPVYLLAAGDVNIAGAIDVSGFSPTNSRKGGLGGPGGFGGGLPAFNGLSGGDGYGPGGGKSGTDDQGACKGVAATVGAGAYSSTANGSYDSTRKGIPYGSQLLVPLVGGSGGGGGPYAGAGGGGGGGAILIASSTRIDIPATGRIRADGALGLIASPCCCSPLVLNPGSGGAIRLVAPVVAGTGTLSANGPTTGYIPPNNYGRIRVDSIDRGSIFLTPDGNYTIGTYMVGFPPSRLDIVEVGGTNIVEGSGPVAIQLPNNSDTNVSVTVQARDFNSTNVPVNVVLTPENGPRSVYTTTLNNSTNNNPARSTINVVLPVNTIVTISAWKP